MQRRSVLRAAGASALLAATPFVRAQGSLQPFKFNLGWKVEASGAGFLLALQRGYYKEAGLDVAIDTGNGSAAAISLVGSGAYDAASADLSTMIEFNLANPQAALKAVAIQYDLNPNSVIVRKDGPIKKPADLAGKSILGQPFNASRKLFPVFAKAQGFDANGVKWENVAPDIGDTRFVKGDFDAVAYFFFTGLLNLKARGMGAEQLTVFRFSELGLKSYGNGLVANPKSMANAPEAMSAFVKAGLHRRPACRRCSDQGPRATRQRGAGAGATQADRGRHDEDARHPRQRLGRSHACAPAGDDRRDRRRLRPEKRAHRG